MTTFILARKTSSVFAQKRRKNSVESLLTNWYNAMLSTSNCNKTLHNSDTIRVQFTEKKTNPTDPISNSHKTNLEHGRKFKQIRPHQFPPLEYLSEILPTNSIWQRKRTTETESIITLPRYSSCKSIVPSLSRSSHLIIIQHLDEKSRHFKSLSSTSKS